MSSSRPLHVLRKWITEGHMNDIVETDKTISYGGETLDLDQPTEYRIVKKTANQSNKTEIYTLHQIWVLLLNKDITYTKYIAICKEKNLNNVTFRDKKNIIEWLEGTKTTIEGIVETPEETNEAAEASSQAPPQAGGEDSLPSAQNASIDASSYPAQEKPEDKISQPAEIEIKLDSTSEKVDSRPVIEYEKIRTIDSALLCTYDFSEMLHQNEVLKKMDSIGSQKDKYSADSQGLNGYGGDSIINAIPQKSQFQNYIILVSFASSGLINNSNIEEFLINGRWIKPTEKRNQKHFVISHTHTEKLRQLKYDVVADERILTDNDWGKVVAIFVIGKTWQIRNYKPNEPQTLFQKILGIYVGWDQDPVPHEIRTWRIKTFKINKNSRHGDHQAVNDIWHEIEVETEKLKKKRND